MRLALILLAICSALSSVYCQSLVTYWDFENNTLDQAIAGAAPDTATWNGTPAFTGTSPLGDGILLDGSNSLSVAASADIAGAATLTISGWFRVDQWDTPSQTILHKGAAPNYAIQRDDSTSALSYIDGAGNPSGGNVDDGAWHHFVTVSSAAETTRLFIDGELAGSAGASNIIDSGAPLVIGNDPTVAGRGWKGAIDDLGIIRDGLTSLQVKALFTLGQDTRFKYRLPEVLSLITMHAQGANGQPLLLDNDTWVYAASDPGGMSTFVRLGTDLSGIRLSPGPAIEEFDAQPNFIASGNSSPLSWSITPPFTAVSISPTVGDVTGNTSVSGQGTATAQPAVTTTYTLTATSAAGSNIQRTTVFVGLDPQAPRIHEIVARPEDDEELDQFGNAEDWIEIYNPGNAAVDLGTYYLTDNQNDLTKWSIPSVNVAAGDYLRIFASSLNLTTDSAFLHTNFSLSGGGEFLALTRDDGAGGVEVLNQFTPSYPSVPRGFSYGYSTDASQLGIFQTPSPGATNGTPFDGIVADTNFTIGRGFFSAPIQVGITTTTAAATIRYTLDGSTPTATNGLDYSEPISISSTTVLRAFAMRPGFFSTNVDTQSYFFIDDLRDQFPTGAAPAGWPATTVNGQVFDYGMDPQVLANLDPGEIDAALTAIPSLSLVTDIGNLTDPATGIYVNASERGREWERAASIELLDPIDGSSQFQAECGVRIRGGSSRRDRNPKHAFRLFFRSEYGDSKLNYPLFGTDGVTSFDKIDLRTAQNYSWSFQGASTGSQNTFLREVLGRDLQAAFDQPHTRSRYYHLYINGIYWGLFMTQERAGADFGNSYLGGSDSDFDTLKSRGNSGSTDRHDTEASDGSFELGTPAAPGSDWAHLYHLTRAQNAAPTTARYMEMQGLNPDGTRNSNFPVLLDVDNLISYHLIIGYTGNYDAPLSAFVNASNNWFGLRNRVDDDRGFAFFVHDGEHSLGANNGGRWGPHNDRMNTRNGSATRDAYNKYNPGYVHLDLAESTPEYRRRFGDLAHAALFNDGVLTRDRVFATYEERRSTVDSVIHAESVRWGDADRVQPYLKSDWEAELIVLEDVLETRNQVFLGHLKQAGLYPMLAAPAFSTDQRRLAPSTSLFLSSEEGLIYYTLDGRDPIGPDGLPAPSALSTNGAPSDAQFIGNASAQWRYLDTGVDLGDSSIVDGAPGYDSTHWKHPDFVESGWEAGPGPLGFGAISGMTFGTPISDNDQVTTYLRTEFNVDSTATVVELSADYQRDDAFILYLNGTEILRDNLPAGTVTSSQGTSDASPESMRFTTLLDSAALVNGRNVIAIELHNSRANSSDVGIDFQLNAKIATQSDPILINGPTEIRSRTFTVADGEWSALNSGVFTTGDAATSANLIISEVNYRPGALTAAEATNINVTDRDDFEFIEITNISATPIDLGGAKFIQRLEQLEVEGITFTFPPGTTIAPRSSLLVVENAAAFPVRYPGVSQTKIAGQWEGGLDNSNEWIILQGADGNEIASFRYSDNSPWPTQADGDGPTLQLANTAVQSNPDYQNAANWQPSPAGGGSPGSPPSLPFTGDPLADNDQDGAVALLEYFTGTSDFAPEEFDFPGVAAIDIGGENQYAIVFRQTPSAQPVSFEVESSIDLVTWATNTIFVSSTELPDGRIEHTYRATPPTGADQQFFRLRLSQ